MHPYTSNFPKKVQNSVAPVY